MLFDTSAAAGALVYSRYAKSAGTASLVPAAGGTPTTVASGWVSHALFVENGKRIAIVMLSGNTLLDGSIDLVDPATAARTSLATGVRLDQYEYLFAPERLGYYVGSTSPLDLVIERLDVGDRFTVSDVNNVWQQSPNKHWLAVYTAGSGLRTVDLDTGTVHFVSARPVNNFEFTADSQRVVFSDQIAIYSADASTGTVTQLAQSNEYLLSPDGRLVLVQPSISSPLQVVPVTGGGARYSDRRCIRGVSTDERLLERRSVHLLSDSEWVQGGVHRPTRCADPDDGGQWARPQLCPSVEDRLLHRRRRVRRGGRAHERLLPHVPGPQRAARDLGDTARDVFGAGVEPERPVYRLRRA